LAQLQAEVTDAGAAVEEEEEKVDARWEFATFGNGCFGCTDAVFEEFMGVNQNEAETVHAPKK